MTQRRFSNAPFGEALTELMAETGTSYRQLAAASGLSAGYLNHIVHGNRPIPATEAVARIGAALGVEPEHFREIRARIVAERLEAMPELVNRLYKKLAEQP